MTPLCWLKQTHLFRHNSYFQVIMRRVFCFTASDSWHGGSHGGYNPGPMGNPVGDLCCSAGDEFADATAPCCSGALEDEASATDLTARLGVSQPCCPTTAWEHGSQLWHLSGSPSLPEIPPKAVGLPVCCYSIPVKREPIWFCHQELQLLAPCLPFLAGLL